MLGLLLYSLSRSLAFLLTYLPTAYTTTTTTAPAETATVTTATTEVTVTTTAALSKMITE